MIRVALLAAVTAVVLSAASANASTVSSQTTESCNRGGCSSVVTVTVAGAPGEANRIVVSEPDSGHVFVRDQGAPLAAGAGCEAVAGGGRCPLGDLGIDTGDGDDRVDATGISRRVAATGGDGADELLGGADADYLRGGDGSDRLHGGPGSDSFSGDDTAPAADAIDGGPGVDELRGDLAAPRLPTDIDLLRERGNGAPEEDDTLRNIEDVWGGPLADSIAGNHGPNWLLGDASDTLIGRGGTDILSGGRLLDGGRGNDRLSFGHENRCGGGRDAVDNPRSRVGDSLPLVGRDCERLEQVVADSVVFSRETPRRRGELATVSGTCPSFGSPCRVTFAVRAASTRAGLHRHPELVSRKVFRSRQGQPYRFTARPSRRARNRDEWLAIRIATVQPQGVDRAAIVMPPAGGS
jgi:hypothetical protein